MKQVSDIDIWAEQHLNGNTPQLSELRCGQKKKKGVTKIELQHVLINKQLSRPSQVNLKWIFIAFHYPYNSQELLK